MEKHTDGTSTKATSSSSVHCGGGGGSGSSSSSTGAAALPAPPFQDYYAHVVKIVIIGDGGVGKTALKRALCNREWDSDEDPPSSIYSAVTVTLNDEVHARVQVWDPSGHEHFLAAARSFYNGAHIVMIVFNLEIRQTFENCSKWVHHSTQHTHADTKYILVGNKLDGKRQVSKEEAERFAEKLELHYVEVSSLLSLVDMLGMVVDVTMREGDRTRCCVS